MSAATFSLSDLSALGFGTSATDLPAPPPPSDYSAPDLSLVTGAPPQFDSSGQAVAPAPAAAPNSGLNAFEQAISGLSGLAAPWFTSVTGQSVVPLPTSAENAALQQTQIQQQAQAKLLQTAPTTAGLLANPTVILFGVGIVLLILFATRK